MRGPLIPVGSSDLFGSDSPLKKRGAISGHVAFKSEATVLLDEHIIQLPPGRGAEHSHNAQNYFITGDLITLGSADATVFTHEIRPVR